LIPLQYPWPNFLKLIFGAILISGFSACDTGINAAHPETPMTKIQLMTSLPIIWGEGASMDDILSGSSKPAPIYSHWLAQHNVEAVDSLEGLKNSGTDIVLLAQPPAMDPADLAVLDEWVRGGGNALIFTDPMLLWNHDYPVGDSSAPIAIGLLSPLLDHWGVSLLGPDEKNEGMVDIEFQEYSLSAAGIGSFAKNEGSEIECQFASQNFIAICELSEGRIILVADADLLNHKIWSDQKLEQPGESGAMRLTDMLISQLEQK